MKITLQVYFVSWITYFVVIMIDRFEMHTILIVWPNLCNELLFAMRHEVEIFLFFFGD